MSHDLLKNMRNMKIQRKGSKAYHMYGDTKSAAAVYMEPGLWVLLPVVTLNALSVRE